MRYEVIEYYEDDGSGKTSSAYEIEASELGATIDSLNERIKSGKLKDADITPV